MMGVNSYWHGSKIEPLCTIGAVKSDLRQFSNDVGGSDGPPRRQHTSLGGRVKVCAIRGVACNRLSSRRHGRVGVQTSEEPRESQVCQKSCWPTANPCTSLTLNPPTMSVICLLQPLSLSGAPMRYAHRACCMHMMLDIAPTLIRSWEGELVRHSLYQWNNIPLPLQQSAHMMLGHIHNDKKLGGEVRNTLSAILLKWTSSNITMFGLVFNYSKVAPIITLGIHIDLRSLERVGQTLLDSGRKVQYSHTWITYWQTSTLTM